MTQLPKRSAGSSSVLGGLEGEGGSRIEKADIDRLMKDAYERGLAEGSRQASPSGNDERLVSLAEVVDVLYDHPSGERCFAVAARYVESKFAPLPERSEGSPSAPSFEGEREEKDVSPSGNYLNDDRVVHYLLRFLSGDLTGASAAAMVVAGITGTKPRFLPRDEGDLARCRRAYENAPESLRGRLSVPMATAEDAVAGAERTAPPNEDSGEREGATPDERPLLDDDSPWLVAYNALHDGVRPYEVLLRLRSEVVAEAQPKAQVEGGQPAVGNDEGISPEQVEAAATAFYERMGFNQRSPGRLRTLDALTAALAAAFAVAGTAPSPVLYDELREAVAKAIYDADNRDQAAPLGFTEMEFAHPPTYGAYLTRAEAALSVATEWPCSPAPIPKED